jgi:hypothetical protein
VVADIGLCFPFTYAELMSFPVPRLLYLRARALAHLARTGG